MIGISATEDTEGTENCNHRFHGFSLIFWGEALCGSRGATPWGSRLVVPSRSDQPSLFCVAEAMQKPAMARQGFFEPNPP